MAIFPSCSPGLSYRKNVAYMLTAIPRRCRDWFSHTLGSVGHLQSFFRQPNLKNSIWKEALYYTGSCFFIYMMSFVFRIAIDYFRVKRQAEQMLEQKSLAELNLLKSQVQPHFLFNTLNNIYYEAFREAPRTAQLIGRLSDIMRYFVDESPKEKVTLATEIKFLENYIALEEIRIRHGVNVTFDQQYEGEPGHPAHAPDDLCREYF